METGILYRGVNPEMHAACDGELRPKETKPFLKSPKWGRAEWGNAFWGESPKNAAIEHQRHQAGYPTSGVSTTPILERAKFYATNGSKLSRGFVYVISVESLTPAGVTAYVVNDIAPMPSIPEDEEVILVAQDFGPLPRAIVVEILEFGA
jgi:hypothetical protein